MVNILQISQFQMNSNKFSSNSDRIVDRILSRKVRMVRSLGDRTFQPRFQALAAATYDAEQEGRLKMAAAQGMAARLGRAVEAALGEAHRVFRLDIPFEGAVWQLARGGESVATGRSLRRAHTAEMVCEAYARRGFVGCERDGAPP